jgi:hypothetical protein
MELHIPFVVHYVKYFSLFSVLYSKHQTIEFSRLKTVTLQLHHLVNFYRTLSTIYLLLLLKSVIREGTSKIKEIYDKDTIFVLGKPPS